MDPRDWTQEEWELMTGMLRTSIVEIQHEIHHTDSSAFRAELKHRKAVMERLLARLEEEEAIAVS